MSTAQNHGKDEPRPGFWAGHMFLGEIKMFITIPVPVRNIHAKCGFDCVIFFEVSLILLYIIASNFLIKRFCVCILLIYIFNCGILTIEKYDN